MLAACVQPQAWQQLLNKLAPGDEVAVFFSGHGVEIEGGNYLVPRDVPAVGTGEARRLKNEALSFDEMRRDLAAHGPKLSLFILDACRDNPFTDTRGRSIGGAKGLVPVQAEYGTFIMFAAGARESALDRLGDTDSDPNSIYTRKLLPLLKQPGLRLPDVAQRVRGEVRQLANTVGHRQSPAYYDEGADDVCLAGCAPQTSEAERAWPWVKNTTNQSVLENFIKQFGDTTFGERAKARLAELKKPQLAVARPVPEEPNTAPSGGKSFDGLWQYTQVGEAVNCRMNMPVGSFLVEGATIRVWGKTVKVRPDGTFSVAQPNQNFPGQTMTMAGTLKDGAGTFTSGPCRRKLKLTRT